MYWYKEGYDVPNSYYKTQTLNKRRNNMAQNNENSGALFKNSKRTSEKAPYYTGKVTVGDVEYYVSGWNNTSKDGQTPYIGLKFESVADAQARKAQAETPQAQPATADDELPF